MKCTFSKYMNIFGIPNTGVHSYRFLNTAIVDYILTILLSIIITFLTNIPLVLTTIFSFIVGIIAHYMFCINTNTIKFMGM